MAGRIRTIKPELLEDEKAAALSDSAWRLFVSSWLLADDHGRFRAGARYLAAMVWQDTARAGLAGEALAELARAGRVRVYRVDGETFAEIPTWSKHQRIDNAGKPRIPPPTPVAEASSSDFDSLRSVSRIPPRAQGVTPPPRGSTSDHGNGPPTSDQEDPASAGSGPLGPGPCPLGLEEPLTAGPGNPPDQQPKDPAIARPPVAPLQLLPAEKPSPAELVFAAYLAGRQRIHPGTRPPKLDDKRRKLIAARLRDFPLEDLEAAARGVWLSEWHVQQQQTGIELVLRDSAHVEKFRDIAARPELGKLHANGASTLQQPAKPGQFNWRNPGAYRPT